MKNMIVAIVISGLCACAHYPEEQSASSHSPQHAVDHGIGVLEGRVNVLRAIREHELAMLDDCERQINHFVVAVWDAYNSSQSEYDRARYLSGLDIVIAYRREHPYSRKTAWSDSMRDGEWASSVYDEARQAQEVLSKASAKMDELQRQAKDKK